MCTYGVHPMRRKERNSMSENGSHGVFVPDLFDRAREVTFDVVLGELGLLEQLKVVGDEIRGKCPLCGGERSFSANPVKGVFNCFRCRKKKSVVDFVAFYQKVEPKEAAEWLVSLLSPVQGEVEVDAVLCSNDTIDEQADAVLTPREVRLLQLMARACARYAGTIVSAIGSEQLEAVAWRVVRQEIVQEFPDTVLPEE
jgi:DNA primase